MTLAELQQRVRDRLDETESTSLRYPNARIEEYMLQGVRYYVVKAQKEFASTTITQTAHTLLYDLPCDCIQVVRVSWDSDGALYPLDATQSRFLDEQLWHWQRTTDIRARAYFLLGLKKIALWPVSPDGGQEYIVHYRQDTYDSIDTVPSEDHELLVNYVVARFLLSEGKVAEGASEYKRFEEGVRKAKRRGDNVDRVWSRQEWRQPR